MNKSEALQHLLQIYQYTWHIYLSFKKCKVRINETGFFKWIFWNIKIQELVKAYIFNTHVKVTLPFLNIFQTQNAYKNESTFQYESFLNNKWPALYLNDTISRQYLQLSFFYPAGIT